MSPALRRLCSFNASTKTPVQQHCHATTPHRRVIAPDVPGSEKTVLFDRIYEDAYTDPGSPASRRTKVGGVGGSNHGG